jgi:preprotein translocase subunit SecA
MDGMLTKLGLKDDEAIIHPWINKALERAQGKVEAHNFDIRKNLLKYDNVMNDQRKVIFEQRIELMTEEKCRRHSARHAPAVVEELVAQFIPERAYPEQWDVTGLTEAVRTQLAWNSPSLTGRKKKA